MRTGYTTAIPHTNVEVSAEERAQARRRYTLLIEIEQAAREGDVDRIKALAGDL